MDDVFAGLNNRFDERCFANACNVLATSCRLLSLLTRITSNQHLESSHILALFRERSPAWHLDTRHNELWFTSTIEHLRDRVSLLVPARNDSLTGNIIHQRTSVGVSA